MQKRSETEKKNITIKFYIFTLVWVPHLSFSQQTILIF